MRVLLCGGEAFVTEQLLDAPQIHAAVEQMGGKRVTQRVRGDRVETQASGAPAAAARIPSPSPSSMGPSPAWPISPERATSVANWMFRPGFIGPSDPMAMGTPALSNDFIGM